MASLHTYWNSKTSEVQRGQLKGDTGSDVDVEMSEIPENMRVSTSGTPGAHSFAQITDTRKSRSKGPSPKTAITPHESQVQSLGVEDDQATGSRIRRSEQQNIRRPTRGWSKQKHQIPDDPESRIEELEESLNQAKEENKQLRRKQKDLEQSIRIIQEKARKKTSEGQWLPRQDVEIHDDLISLQEDIEDWATMCGLRTMPHLESLEDGEKIQLWNYVSKVAWLPDEMVDLSSLKEFGGKVPTLLLSALLAHDIFSQIFEDPFYFLNADAHMDWIQQGMPPSCVLKSAYDELIKVDEREAHIWRSQMIRLFNPPSPSGNADTDANKNLASNKMLDRIHRCSSDLATAFRAGPARYFIEEDIPLQEIKDERHEVLEDIFRKACQIASRLWTQRTYLKCEHFSNLSSQPFSVKSQIMKAHSSHCLDGSDDHRLDNTLVRVVIYPAVLAFGDHDAENFDTGRVWAKALVLVEEPLPSFAF
jgi:hypothetical protein